MRSWSGSAASPSSAASRRPGGPTRFASTLAQIGHPILSDSAYSGRPNLTNGDLLGPDHPEADVVFLARQALHAHALDLTHPVTGESLHFQAPLPDDLAAVLAALRAPSELTAGRGAGPGARQPFDFIER